MNRSGTQSSTQNDFAVDDLEIRSSIESLRQGSKLSLILVLVGAVFLAFSVYYSASQLTPLEGEVAAKKKQIADLAAEEMKQRARLADAQRELESLKASTEALYAVRVTPSNQVYEVKATAKATGRQLSLGRTEYEFKLLINSPADTLASIARVKYQMEHETFKQRDYVSEDAVNQFAASYVGWGCLSTVKVAVQLKTGETQNFDFNMCRSLGPQWQ
jgi:hypothetical protein